MREQDDVHRVWWASRSAPGGRQLVGAPLSTPDCIPQDAEYGRRDAHPTRDMPVCFPGTQFFPNASPRGSGELPDFLLLCLDEREPLPHLLWESALGRVAVVARPCPPRRQMRGAVRRGFAWRGVMHGRSGDGKNSARVSSAHQLTEVRETAAMKFGAERRGTQRLCHVAMHSQIQNAPAAGQTSSIQHSVPPNTQPPAAAQRLNKKCPRVVEKAMDGNAETQSKTGPNRLPPASLLCVSASLRFFLRLITQSLSRFSRTPFSAGVAATPADPSGARLAGAGLRSLCAVPSAVSPCRPFSAPRA